MTDDSSAAHASDPASTPQEGAPEATSSEPAPAETATASPKSAEAGAALAAPQESQEPLAESALESALSASPATEREMVAPTPPTSAHTSLSTAISPAPLPGGRSWSREDRQASLKKRLGKKEALLEKIMQFAREKKRIANDEIVKKFHVSDISATRYVRTLVMRGLLKREGKGRGTAYSTI